MTNVKILPYNHSDFSKILAKNKKKQMLMLKILHVDLSNVCIFRHTNVYKICAQETAQLPQN